MHEIYTNLWVGGDDDYLKVKNLNGWSWLRACKYGPDGHRDTLLYDTLGAPKGPEYLHVRRRNFCALNLIDVDDPNFIPFECIKYGLDFVKEELAKNRKVLIACNQGHSRGPSIGLMFLRAIGDMPHNFLTSEKIYRAIYPKYDPALGIRQIARDSWTLLNNLENTT